MTRGSELNERGKLTAQWPIVITATNITQITHTNKHVTQHNHPAPKLNSTGHVYKPAIYTAMAKQLTAKTVNRSDTKVKQTRYKLPNLTLSAPN
jgi:hypothetical protein